MPIYNLIEYSDNYSKTSWILWQYCRDVAAVDANGAITDFTEANATIDLFSLKKKLTGETGTNGTNNVKIMVPLKYLSNVWRTPEMLLINFEITLEICIVVATNEQLKSGLKRTINWNKYQTKVSIEKVNEYLDFLIDPCFQGVNRLFVLPFENEAQNKSYKGYYLLAREIKYYNIMIDGQNVFDQPIRNNLITYDNIRKVATGQGDDYTTGCLLDCNNFKNYYKMIAIDLNKQQALDVDPEAIQKLNFTGNVENQSAIFFVIEKAKETVFDFLRRNS